jgi:hypothetical protein
MVGLQLWQCDNCQTVRQWGRGAPLDQERTVNLTCEVCGKGSESSVISHQTGMGVTYVTLHTPHKFIGLR